MEKHFKMVYENPYSNIVLSNVEMLTPKPS